MVHRIAVVEQDLCQTKKCGLECIKECPVNINGQECITLPESRIALVSEGLCIGCGICVKVCPFDAIDILNLSEELKTDKIHQYGVNSFRLFRIPTVRKGQVVGLVGRNGIGKSTALKILAGQLVPNLGDYEREGTWDRFVRYLSGREMKEHFERVADGELKVSLKPQAVYKIPEAWKGKARGLLEQMDERKRMDEVADLLSLRESLDKDLPDLSGGELQRVAVAAAALKDADLYLFDEPSSYNDVYQRLAVSKLITGLAEEGKAVLVVEHDIAFLDYVTDYVQIIYGEPGAYGIVSGLYPARTGINALLDGYLPQENVRFRDHAVSFDVRAAGETVESEAAVAKYTELTKSYQSFSLRVGAGEIKGGSIVGAVGANALGKTTFLKMLAGVEKPAEGTVHVDAKVAYKPQYLSSDFEGTVEEFFMSTLGTKYNDPVLQDNLVAPLRLEKLMARKVGELSGGELQKVAVVATMAQESDVYALDEPSAFLDVEDRFVVSRAINRMVKARGKAAVVIDHDLQVIDIVSDRLLVFSGEPGVAGEATPPLTKEAGMNDFLSRVGLTYRRDVNTGRPRVNKPGSKLDREQKERGDYYYVPAQREESAPAD
ncbi:MAG: ribosome biogenesis/translation initiation ATPase RLI [Nitrososphaerota archaeon]|jgi:ATP-binding cassette subfamily E protein 1|nr:ribosome biogenesis/translation initiation ATPase RLI [Nitrososphaerota archaeon]MDG6941923.1 ribosome biogenesis/translation initiation ATPase RLI [Nitrososphaerota archaeon]MDG6946904.1 ribosome biogenesis/translation initiation ATPase RLI [Nitrososphaerota archaeon]